MSTAPAGWTEERTSKDLNGPHHVLLLVSVLYIPGFIDPIAVFELLNGMD